MQRSEGGTALLALDGFVAGGQLEEAGEIGISVETGDDVAGRPLCAIRTIGHGRQTGQARDLPSAARSAVLV